MQQGMVSILKNVWKWIIDPQNFLCSLGITLLFFVAIQSPYVMYVCIAFMVSVVLVYGWCLFQMIFGRKDESNEEHERNDE